MTTLRKEAIGHPRPAIVGVTRESDAITASHPLFGAFRISADGAHVACDPPEIADWLWQRFLVGQVLPIAAMAQGLAPLHAAAVAVDGAGLLVLGTSGAGKTSTAIHIAARGGQMVADDVAVIDCLDTGVVVHPGSALFNVDPHELARIPPDSFEVLGHVDGKARILLGGTCREAVMIDRVALVIRSDEHRELCVERDPPGWAPALLGAHFSPAVADPRAMAGWLHVCAALAASAATLTVRAPVRGSAADVADAILGA